MIDHEYILAELRRDIRHTLEGIENRIVCGNVSDMEDYKYNLGIRYALTKVEAIIELLSREDV
jgi:hypothetical protein